MFSYIQILSPVRENQSITLLSSLPTHSKGARLHSIFQVLSSNEAMYTRELEHFIIIIIISEDIPKVPDYIRYSIILQDTSFPENRVRIPRQTEVGYPEKGVRSQTAQRDDAAEIKVLV